MMKNFFEDYGKRVTKSGYEEAIKVANATKTALEESLVCHVTGLEEPEDSSAIAAKAAIDALDDSYEAYKMGIAATVLLLRLEIEKFEGFTWEQIDAKYNNQEGPERN